MAPRRSIVPKHQDRVDLACPSRWPPGGKANDDDDEEGDGHERGGIGRRHTVKLVGDEAPQRQRRQKPEEHTPTAVIIAASRSTSL